MTDEIKPIKAYCAGKINGINVIVEEYPATHLTDEGNMEKLKKLIKDNYTPTQSQKRAQDDIDELLKIDRDDPEYDDYFDGRLK